MYLHAYTFIEREIKNERETHRDTYPYLYLYTYASIHICMHHFFVADARSFRPGWLRKELSFLHTHQRNSTIHVYAYIDTYWYRYIELTPQCIFLSRRCLGCLARSVAERAACYPHSLTKFHDIYLYLYIDMYWYMVNPTMHDSSCADARSVWPCLLWKELYSLHTQQRNTTI